MSTTQRPQLIFASLTETLELALIETLHALGVSEAASQRLLKHTLDPEGLEQHFFAACDLRADLRQARKALETAQLLLATLHPAMDRTHAGNGAPSHRAA